MMSEQKHRMITGELYHADDPQLTADRTRCRALVEQLNATGTDSALRHKLLHELLGHLGEGSEIMAPLQCDYGYQIRVGARTFINYGAVFLDSAAITIGDDVQIGPSVQLLTATHPFEPSVRRTGAESA